MHKITSMWLDEELKDYVASFGADYSFKSLSALVNGIFYYAKYHINPKNIDIRKFLEDVMSGKLTTPRALERKLVMQTAQELDLFCKYMDENWGNSFLQAIIMHGLHQYIDRQEFIENVRREFCHKHDIPLYMWETRAYIKIWYGHAEQSGRLRHINKCTILGELVDEHTWPVSSESEESRNQNHLRNNAGDQQPGRGQPQQKLTM